MDEQLFNMFATHSKTAHTPIVYFEAFFSGGIGEQKALVWKDGNVIFKKQSQRERIPDSFEPINEALKTIGVIAKDGKDEFLTIGLGRHRQMWDWFEEATGISVLKYLEE